MKIFKQIGDKLFYRGGLFHPTKGLKLNWVNDLNEYIKENKKIVNVGAGNYQKLGVINVDPGYIKEDKFHIKAFGEKLPFENNSIDFVICNAVLEHVSDPQKIISEIFRILKFGGRVYVDIAFMQPLHAAPCDYVRWTANKLEDACCMFKKISVGACMGPGSALAKMIVEYNQLFFQNKLFKKIIKNFSKIMVASLKYIDAYLVKKNDITAMPGGVYFYGEK